MAKHWAALQGFMEGIGVELAGLLVGQNHINNHISDLHDNQRNHTDVLCGECNASMNI